jgi:hypothetical protein
MGSGRGGGGNSGGEPLSHRFDGVQSIQFDGEVLDRKSVV